MRYRFAIRDDREEVMTAFSRVLREKFARMDLDLEVALYPESQKMLADVAAGEHFDAVFTPIQLRDMCGIKLGGELRRLGMDGALVYQIFKDQEEWVFETFVNRPFWVVRQSHHLEDLDALMPHLLEEIAPKEKMMFLHSCGKVFRLNPEDIYSIESHDKYLHIAMRGQNLKIRYRMEDIEKELEGQYFVCIHRGILVNCRYIVQVDRESVTLENQVRLPISRYRMAEVKHTFAAYRCRYAQNSRDIDAESVG